MSCRSDLCCVKVNMVLYCAKQVRPHLLYLPNQLAGSSLVEPGTQFALFDRVVRHCSE